MIGALRRHLRPALRPGLPGDGRPGGSAVAQPNPAPHGSPARRSRTGGAPSAARPPRRGPASRPPSSELISELQAALIDPATLRERAAETGPYELEIASPVRGLREGPRSARSPGDEHSRARTTVAALGRTRTPGARGPCFLYGFDDLTLEQLELVRELARIAPSDRGPPLGGSRGADRGTRSAVRGAARHSRASRSRRSNRRPSSPRSRTLFELERRFGEPAVGVEPVPNDGGLALLASAGELAEAEAVGAEVARLLRRRRLSRARSRSCSATRRSAGPLYRRVLSRFAIPTAVQADLAVSRTVTGAGLIALLEASVGRAAAPRTCSPTCAPPAWPPRPGSTGSSAGCSAAGCGRPTRRSQAWAREGENGAGAPSGAREAARCRVGPRPAPGSRQARLAGSRSRRSGGSGAIAGEDRALELRTGAEIERALSRAGGARSPPHPARRDLGGRGPRRADVARPNRGAGAGDQPLPGAGAPRLAPLRLLAAGRRLPAPRHRRAAALRRRPGGARAAAAQEGRGRGPLPVLGLPLAAQAEAVALLAERGRRGRRDRSLAVRRRGPRAARARSCRAAPRSATRRWRPRRAAAASPTPSSRQATPPSEVELARAEGRARHAEDAASVPGAAQACEPGARSEWREQKLFGPSTLEEYASCPYRWFVGHELRPPPDRPRGGAAHRRADRSPGSGGPLRGSSARRRAAPPRRPSTAWREARPARSPRSWRPELLPRERADTAAALHRVEGLVLAFLADEAETPAPFAPDPELAEARFGFDDSEKGAPAARRRRRPRPDRPDRPRPRRGGAGPGLQVGSQGRGRQAGCSRRASSSSSSTCSRPASSGGSTWREASTGRSEPATRRTASPRGCCARSSREELAGLDPRPGRPPRRRGVRRARSTRPGEGRARSSARSRTGDIGRRPIGGSLPELLPLPADLPPRARHRRGGAHLRGRGRGMSERTDTAARGRRRARPRRLPARRGRHRQDDRARRPLLLGGRSIRTAGSSASSPSPSPSGPPTSSAAGSARSSPSAPGGRGRRSARSSPRRPRRPTAPGSRPSTASAAACSPPTRPRRASIPASGSSTSPRRSGWPSAPSTRPSSRWSSEGDAEALELAAANRRRTLTADDARRLRRAAQPRRPGARHYPRHPPSRHRGSGLADLIEAAREAHVECAEAKGQGRLPSRERIATASELDPDASRTRSCSSRWRPRDHLDGEGASRAKPASATRQLCKRARAAVAASVLGPPTSSCAS